MSVIAFSSGVPACTGLGQYTMQRDVKDDVVQKVILYSPGKDVVSMSSVSFGECALRAGAAHKQNHFMLLTHPTAILYAVIGEACGSKSQIIKVYDCYLEEMAGRILEDPYKSLDEPKSLGMYPLVYDIDEQPGVNVRLMTHAAIDTWKKYIPHVTFGTFGCNYRHENGAHKYLCIFN
ncbi:hypothetical protein Y032_0018g3499 [Ancylostoma ceylanicum]|uniref:Uncharacterized protein n=1 Tax=Ancylostoma ceylanicum TaxID=53326 RepID=A0A016V3Z3_9BILA|nr:hypothetical protein Y032_0018g3499 [Ancylostoma ceylanicum]